MNTSLKLLNYAALVVFGLLGQAAVAAPMTQGEFLNLVQGGYGIVLADNDPVTQENSVRIYEQDGQIFLENLLRVGTKNVPAVYRVTTFECYTHSPQATTCGFAMSLVDVGAYVHFLGVNPVVNVDRRSEKLRLEVRPDYSRIGESVSETTLERTE